MNIAKWLTFFAARAKITPDLIPKFAKIIEADLKADHPAAHARYSKALYMRLAQEAYRRAAQSEEDQIARNWPMLSQTEDITRKIMRIVDGDQNVDAEIEIILRHFETN